MGAALNIDTGVALNLSSRLSYVRVSYVCLLVRFYVSYLHAHFSVVYLRAFLSVLLARPLFICIISVKLRAVRSLTILRLLDEGVHFRPSPTSTEHRAARCNSCYRRPAL